MPFPASGFGTLCRSRRKSEGDHDRNQALRKVSGVRGPRRSDDEPGLALGPAFDDQRVADDLRGSDLRIEAAPERERTFGRSFEIGIQIDTPGCAGRDLDWTRISRKPRRLGGGGAAHEVSRPRASACGSGRMAVAASSRCHHGAAPTECIRVSSQLRHSILICEGANAAPSAFGAMPFCADGASILVAGAELMKYLVDPTM